MFELFETKYENIYTYICEPKNYFGTTKGEFQAQYNNHKKSFTHCFDEKATELSNTFRKPSHIWKTRWSDLCVTEKLLIAKAGSRKVLKNG